MFTKKPRLTNLMHCKQDVSDEANTRKDIEGAPEQNTVKKISPEKKELTLREIELKHNINLVERLEEEGLEKARRGASPADLNFLNEIAGKDYGQVIRDLSQGTYSPGQ